MKGFLSIIGFLFIVMGTLGVAWFSVSVVRFENGLKNINQVKEEEYCYSRTKFWLLEYIQYPP